MFAHALFCSHLPQYPIQIVSSLLKAKDVGNIEEDCNIEEDELHLATFNLRPMYEVGQLLVTATEDIDTTSLASEEIRRGHYKHNYTTTAYETIAGNSSEQF